MADRITPRVARYRSSRGMRVNGEPRLTCATFLADSAPGPVTVEKVAPVTLE